MDALLLGLAIGLIVGWNVLPQPRWIERLYNKGADRFRD